MKRWTEVECYPIDSLNRMVLTNSVLPSAEGIVRIVPPLAVSHRQSRTSALFAQIPSEGRPRSFRIHVLRSCPEGMPPSVLHLRQRRRPEQSAPAKANRALCQQD